MDNYLHNTSHKHSADSGIRLIHVFVMIMISMMMLPSAFEANGQGIIPTKGKDFWLGFPQQPNVYTSSKRCDLFITSEYNTFGIVQIPAQGWSLPFSVVANQTTTINIPLAIAEHISSQTIDNKGIQVLSNDTISLFAISFQDYSADGTVVYPKQSLGTEYRIASYRGLSGYPSQFLIVATEDDTEFIITTTAPTAAGNATGVPFTVSLNAGESYQVRANSATGDFTGSTIIATDSSGSCRPFAVFSGTECVNIPVGCSACDVLYDQALPVNYWGKTYYSSPFMSTTGYTIRILADQNATSVVVDGGAPQLLNAGQFIEINNIATGKCIDANKPISVVQYMQGVTCSGAGDPAMMYLNAVEQKISQVAFSTVTSAVITQHYVNVILNTSHTGQLKLDGVTVAPASFTAIPACPNVSYARLSLTQGSHTLEADSGFSAYVYGTGSAESYAYSVGSFNKSQPVILDSVFCSSDTIQIGNTSTLYGCWWSTFDNQNDTIGLGPVLTLLPPITPGIYVLHGNEFISGCEKTFQYAVQVPDPPQTWVTSAVSVVCTNTQVQLNAGTTVPLPGATYSWTPTAGLNNPNISNPVLTATTSGWYHVAIAANNNCTPTVYDSIYIDVLPVTATNISTGGAQAVCLGASATLTAAGGVSYQWLPGGQTGNSITVAPIVTTNYIVLATDSNGCESTDTVTVTVNPLPNANAGADVTVCTGVAVNLVASGGVSYVWNPGGATTATISVSPAATANYIVQVTGANGCIDTDTVTVFVDPAPQVFAVGDQTICRFDSVTISAAGTGTLVWNPGNITGNMITVAPTVTTQYIVSVQGIGCIGSDTVLVTVNPLPQVNAGPNQVICPGASANITASGASTYVWNPGNIPGATISVSPSVATTYTVIGTDANGCTKSDSMIVTLNVPPVISAGIDKTICAGASTSLTGTGGVSYSWMPGGISGATISVSPATTTSYIVTGTNAIGCTNTDTVTVVVNPLPTANAGNDTIICTGTSATITATGGIQYAWTPGGAATASTTVTPAATTAYMVTVTDANGCQDIDSVTVTVNVSPPVVADPDMAICIGNSATINATGATTYVWTPGNINGSSAVVTPGATTAYTVTGFDPNGCSATDVITVTVNPLPLISAGNNQTVCSGTTTSLTGTGGVSYNWMPGNINGTTVSVTPVTNTTYTVTGTDANGCSNIDQVTVSIYQLPTANAGNDTIICTGTSATITATGGVQYAWTPGGAATATITVSPAVTTTYAVNVTDANGCQDVDSITVTVNVTPPVVADPDMAICIGSSATINATGATTYVWTPGNMNGSSAVVTPGATTAYTVTGFDPNGCSATDVITVTVNPLPVIDAGTNQTICAGDVASLTGTGGVTYNWMPGNLNGTTVNVSPVANTTYTVTGTDANGCTDTDQITVIVNQLPTANAGNDTIICTGTTATISATGGVQYAWTPGGASTASTTVTPAATTTYTVTVTDANGCEDTDMVMVTVNVVPPVTADPDLAICIGGTATIDVTGATTYLWTTVNSTDSSIVVNPVVTTVYHVTGFDPYGCSASDSVTVTVNMLPVIDAGNDQTVCDGIAATLTATGGVSYDWTPGGLTGSTVSVTPSVTTQYNVIGTDGNGCQNTSSVIVNVNPLPVVNAGPDQYICPGATTTLSATGGVSYVWTPGAISGSTITITPAIAQNYIAQATDINGCINTDTVYVDIRPLPLSDFTPISPVCENSQVAFSNLSTVAAGSLVQYNWNFGDGGSSSLFEPQHTYQNAGSYQVSLAIVSDAGCHDTITYDLVVNPLPVVSFTTSNQCTGLPAVFTDISTVNPTQIVSWSWDFGDGTPANITQNPEHTYDAPGWYDVTLTLVTDSGCTAQQLQPQALQVYPLPVASFTYAPQEISILEPKVYFKDLSTGAVSWDWDFGDGAGISAEQHPVYLYGDTGNYAITLVAISNHGCTDTIYGLLRVDPYFTLYIPNAFTPNGDGVNEGFLPYGIGVHAMDMLIFDRWGKAIFRSDNPNQPWNGLTETGAECSQGVYVYKVRVKDFKNKEREFTGQVSLIR